MIPAVQIQGIDSCRIRVHEKIVGDRTYETISIEFYDEAGAECLHVSGTNLDESRMTVTFDDERTNS